MTQDDYIAEHLKHFHCGERNIVVSSQLEVIFGLSGSDLRRAVNRLRGSGIPICSSDHGYFYAENELELKRTISQLRSRIRKIAFAERGLTRALRDMEDTGQISFPMEGGDRD